MRPCTSTSVAALGSAVPYVVDGGLQSSTRTRQRKAIYCPLTKIARIQKHIGSLVLFRPTQLRSVPSRVQCYPLHNHSEIAKCTFASLLTILVPINRPTSH